MRTHACAPRRRMHVRTHAHARVRPLRASTPSVICARTDMRTRTSPSCVRSGRAQDTLVSMLTYVDGPPHLVRGIELGPNVLRYVTPVEEFLVDRAELPANGGATLPSAPGVSIVLVLSGAGTLEEFPEDRRAALRAPHAPTVAAPARAFTGSLAGRPPHARAIYPARRVAPRMPSRAPTRTHRALATQHRRRGLAAHGRCRLHLRRLGRHLHPPPSIRPADAGLPRHREALALSA
jgi:hypothetical protein